jgi:hypothetical protein
MLSGVVARITGFGVAIGFGMTKGADVDRCVTEVRTVAAAFVRSCVEIYGPTTIFCNSVGVVAAIRDPIAVRALPTSLDAETTVFLNEGAIRNLGIVPTATGFGRVPVPIVNLGMDTSYA